MPKVIVIDDDGNVRMERESDRPMLPPPAGWDNAKWTAQIVEDLLRQLAKEVAS